MRRVDNFKDFVLLAADKVREAEKKPEMYDTLPYFHHLRPQHHWFIGDTSVYDAVLRYESIDRDVREVLCAGLLQMSLEESGSKVLPHLNVCSDRTEWKQYFNVSDTQVIDAFEKAFGNDFDLGPVKYEKVAFATSKPEKESNERLVKRRQQQQQANGKK